MQPKSSRVAVFFASAIAIVAIVGAVTTRYLQENPSALGSASVTALKSELKNGPGTESLSGTSDWQEPLAEAVATSSYPTSVTDALLSGLSGQYQTLTDSGTSAKKVQEILDAIVAKVVPATEPARVYAISDLYISSSTDMVGYTTILALVLRQTSEVREYELATFNRAVRERNHSGSPELIEDATIYNRIRDQLLAMAIPKSVTTEHLAVVNSLGALAQIVTLMGKWNGDPALGLVYIGEFNKAENAIEGSMSVLSDKIDTLKTT